MTEATVSGPEQRIEQSHAVVQRCLAVNRGHLERSGDELWRLADTQLTVGMGRVDKRNRSAEMRWRLMRVARAVTRRLHTAGAHRRPAPRCWDGPAVGRHRERARTSR